MKKWQAVFTPRREFEDEPAAAAAAAAAPQSPTALQQHQQRDARQIHRTLRLLEKWRLPRLHPNLYRALIRLCSDCKSLDSAILLASIISAKHCSHIPMLANELTRMFSLCGSVPHAHSAYTSNSKPDSFSQNCMLAAYAHNGHLHSALDFFERMPVKDPVSWNTMLTAFLNHGLFQDARDLFNEMPLRTPASWNIMLTAQAQKGHLDQAMELFYKMPPSSSPVTWNILIGAFSRRSNDQVRVVELFRGMLLDGVRPSARTFQPVFSCIESLHLCREIHHLVSELALERNLHVMNSVLECYTRLGSLEDCLQTVGCMGVKDSLTRGLMITAFSEASDLQSAVRVFESVSSHDDNSIAAMSVAYARYGYLQQARSLFEDLVEKPVKTCMALIRAYGKVGDLVAAESLFDSMIEKDDLSWNSMAAAYLDCGHIATCGELLVVMDLQGVRVEDSTLATFFRSCGMTLDRLIFSLGKSLLRDMDLRLVSGEVQDAVLVMYLNRGSFEETCSVFFEMFSARSCSAWTMMIRAYVQNGYGREALEFVRWMSWEGVLPDRSTFEGLFPACRTPVECAGLMHTMVGSFGVEPGLEHYVCMVESLCRAGRVDEAEELVNFMPVEPGIGVWQLVNAARNKKKKV